MQKTTQVFGMVLAMAVLAGCPDKDKEAGKYAKLKKVLFYKDKAGRISVKQILKEYGSFPRKDLCGLYAETMTKCGPELKKRLDVLSEGKDVQIREFFDNLFKLLGGTSNEKEREEKCMSSSDFPDIPLRCLVVWKGLSDAKEFSCSSYNRCIIQATGYVLRKRIEQ